MTCSPARALNSFASRGTARALAQSRTQSAREVARSPRKFGPLVVTGNQHPRNAPRNTHAGPEPTCPRPRPGGRGPLRRPAVTAAAPRPRGAAASSASLRIKPDGLVVEDAERALSRQPATGSRPVPGRAGGGGRDRSSRASARPRAATAPSASGSRGRPTRMPPCPNCASRSARRGRCGRARSWDEDRGAEGLVSAR